MPSCAKTGYDLRSVVSYDSFSCKFVGKGTIYKDGKKIEVTPHPDRTWSGKLASCAGLEDGGPGMMGIPDSSMAAIQRYVYYLADGDNSGLREEDFVCRVNRFQDFESVTWNWHTIVFPISFLSFS